MLDPEIVLQENFWTPRILWGAEIFWELSFFILGIIFSMVSIGGGDVSGGGGLSLQRRYAFKKTS